MGDMVIANKPKQVGGEVFPVNKLPLLTPYAAAIVVMATATITIIKKRRH